MVGVGKAVVCAVVLATAVCSVAAAPEPPHPLRHIYSFLGGKPEVAKEPGTISAFELPSDSHMMENSCKSAYERLREMMPGTVKRLNVDRVYEYVPRCFPCTLVHVRMA